MSSSSLRPTAMPAQITRSIAIAALMGATILASPLSPARAAGVTNTAIQLAQATSPAAPPAATSTPAASPTPAPAVRAQAQAETVEQRIDSLHTQLQITPQEETKWKAVAQTMRDNPAAMQKL